MVTLKCISMVGVTWGTECSNMWSVFLIHPNNINLTHNDKDSVSVSVSVSVRCLVLCICQAPNKKLDWRTNACYVVSHIRFRHSKT